MPGVTLGGTSNDFPKFNVQNNIKQLRNTTLTIDRKTKLKKIKDKEKYTKIILTDNKYDYLTEFPNVKEVTISQIPLIIDSSNIELDKYFQNIEKINFDGITVDWSKSDACTSNLKIIEFSNSIRNIYEFLIKKANNVEEIIFNVNNNDYYEIRPIDEYYDWLENDVASDYFHTYSSKLKTITINKSDGETYKINLDYEIDYIEYLDINYDRIVIKYGNEFIESTTTIYTGITTENVLIDCLCCNINPEEKSIYLPDYITKIDIKDKTIGGIDKVSINLETFDKDFNNISGMFDKKLKIIKIRNNDDMRLMKEVPYIIEDYDKVQNIFILNNILHINYNDKIITIDKDMNIKKSMLVSEDVLTNNSNRLETYKYFQKLLSNIKKEYGSNDEELNKSLEEVDKCLIKQMEIDFVIPENKDKLH